MTERTTETPSNESTTPSAFNEMRNSQNLKELMGWLEGENIAAIVEALRQDKWAKDLIPLYLTHPNHIIRYEIACSDLTSDEDLKSLSKDKEQIVRQGAFKNLRARSLVEEAKKIKEEQKTTSPTTTNETSNDEEKVKISENLEESSKSHKGKNKKQKNKKGKK